MWDAFAVILRPLRPGDREVALKAHQEVAGDEFFTPFLFIDNGETWDSFIAGYEMDGTGKDLAPDRVPDTFLVSEVEGEIIGRVSIRHELNEYLRNFGGHIGFVVRPQFRNQGFATEILALALEISRNLGLSRVLLTCDDKNVASSIVIERCGGVLENKVRKGPGVLMRRYWISLDSQTPPQLNQE
jgi:predicted acetyltransferase